MSHRHTYTRARVRTCARAERERERERERESERDRDARARAMVAYRLCTITATAIAAVLCSLAIWFNVMALVKYRTDDFLEATSVTDFTKKGTCVEYITVDQLKGSGYHKDLDSSSNGCASDNEKGKQLKMRRTLAVSVHGIYYTYFTAGIDYDAMRIVTESVLTATVGGTTVTPPSVNFSVAFEALSSVAAQNVPTSNGCDGIYGMTGESSITSSEATTYLAALRKGRKDDDGNVYASWPLVDIPVTCNNAESSDGVGTIDVASPLTSLQKEKLYAHCLAQFQFASSGTIPYGGTFGVPLVGEPPGPKPDFFYPKPAGFNSTSDYTTKARMFLGQRFGYSVWAYVPMLLATCYLCADAIVFFMTEATLPHVIMEMGGYKSSTIDVYRDSLVMAATTSASRTRRALIGVFAVLVSWIFYGVFVIWPWNSGEREEGQISTPFGFTETRMPRPFCEPGEPDHVGPSMIGWRGTVGGWKADRDATFYDLATLVTQIFVLLFLPFTTLNVFRTCNNAGGIRGSSGGGQTQPTGDQDIQGYVKTNKNFRRVMGSFFAVIVIAGAGMIAGQAVSGARFGMAWAEGVIGQQTYTDETTGVVSPAFNEVTLSEQVYDQTVATIALTVSIGFLVAALMQRHLIGGAGCLSSLLFFAWVGLVCVFSLPLLIYASTRSIFSKSKANEDCAAFPDTGYDFSKGACEARFWSFLIGGILVFLVLGIMTCLGALQAMPKLFEPREKTNVKGRRMVDLYHRAFNFLAGPDIKAAYLEPAAVELDKHPLGGFRSADERFFNFRTGMSVTDDHSESHALLYAPRVSFALPTMIPASVARGARF